MSVILGVDLSLRAAAAVAVPADWDGGWQRVRSIVCGESLRRDATDAERAQRTDLIATQLLAFAHKHGATEAWFESPAFSKNLASHSLGEVAGVCRLAFLKAGIAIHTANQSAARKLLLGKVPRKGCQSRGFPGSSRCRRALRKSRRK